MKFRENWESGLPSLRQALKFMTFSTLFLLFVQYEQPLPSFMNPKPHPRDEEREERIDREIVVDCNDEYEVRTGWHCYLESTMSFPFKAECLLARKSSPLLPGERVTVAEMDDDEENEFGEMKVRVKWQGREFSVPLPGSPTSEWTRIPKRPSPTGTIGRLRDGASDSQAPTHARIARWTCGAERNSCSSRPRSRESRCR